MTAPATTRRAGPFNGNGTTTSFPFTFKVFATTDIAVVKTVDGIDSTLVLDTDYSVALNADQDASPGGSITYPISGDALATGEKLTAVGAIPYDQTADLPTGGNYRAVVVENALDRTVFQVQQLAEELGRALTLPASAATADTELPAPEAGKVIAWNAAGTGLVNVDSADLASVVVAGTAYTNVFSGTGVQTQFTLTANPGGVNALDVAISGISQVNGVDFTVSGTTLTFTAAPPAGTGNIAVRYVAALPVGTANAQDVLYTSPAGVQRTLKARADDWVNAVDFGADPTGVADSTTALQTALNTGRTVRLPAGTYLFTSLQFTADGQGIVGESPFTTLLVSSLTSPGGSSIKSSDQATTKIFCHIENVRVVAGSLTVGYVIDWKSMQFGRLRNVWVFGGGASCVGIYMVANWATTECTYNRVEDCYVGGVGNCVQVGDGANTNTFVNNRGQPLAGGYGYFFNGTATGRVSNNTIVGGGVEYAGAVSRGVYAGQGVDVLTVNGVRFEYLAVAIEATAQASGLYLLGNYYDSNTADYAIASSKTVIVEKAGVTLPNSPSASATELDHYQRGTFSPAPTIIGTGSAGVGTYVVQAGSYTRVGNRVHFELQVQISAHTGTGGMRIEGLPFTQKNQALLYAYAVASENLTYSGTLRAVGIPNTTQIALYADASGTALSAVAMDAVCNLVVSGSYPV